MGSLGNLFAEAIQLLTSGGAEIYGIVLLSLRVSGLAVVLGSLIGLPIGIGVGISRFRGRELIVTLIQSLPPSAPPPTHGRSYLELPGRPGSSATLRLASHHPLLGSFQLPARPLPRALRSSEPVPPPGPRAPHLALRASSGPGSPSARALGHDVGSESPRDR